MLPMKYLLLLSASSLALCGRLAATDAFVTAPTQLTPRVLQYSRADFQADIAASFTHPFDQREIAVDMLLTSPSGQPVVLPAYFESGDTSHSIWKARFSARESGRYQYAFRLTKDGSVTATSAAQAFVATASDGDGILHANNDWTLITDSGRPFRGVGENVGWESRTWEDPIYTYDLFLPELARDGANFFRTWSGAWNLPLEWRRVVDTKRYTDTTAYFNPGGVLRLDQLAELSEALHLRFMLTLDEHGGFLPSAYWSTNPYNAVNGGPCATPADFFVNPEARARYKNRLRYIVARWGCYASVGAWEFFNEVDNAAFDGPAQIPAADITAWHAEMSRYLRSIDPYRHLITTSVSWRDVAGLYDVPDIDFNQRHTYNATATIPAVINRYLTAHAKPFVDGEFSYDWDWNHVVPANGPAFDYDFKYGMWYGLFSPTPIVPMSWWWEFFHERGMIPYLAGVRLISDRMLAAGNGAFVTLATDSGDLHAMAVQCGRTIFVHVHNPTDRPVTTNVNVAVSDTWTRAVESFDPETRTSASAGVVAPQDGALTLPAVALAAHEQRVLVLTAGPRITRPPLSTGVEPGATTTFKVVADDATRYQWRRNGADIAGATSATLAIPAAAPTDAGSYTVIVGGPGGTVESPAARLTLVPRGSERLIDVSTRSLVGPGDERQIAGFVISGSAPKRVVIRASGPALQGFGVPNLLDDPVLDVLSSGTALLHDDDWDAVLASDFSAVGAFAWQPGSRDAAMTASLPPGAYTAQVSGKAGTRGVAIVEVFDSDPAGDSHFVNLSTRSWVGTGDEVQIAGFVVSGPAPMKLLVRAAGPALAQFGLSPVLADPVVKIVSGSSELYANDNWDHSLTDDFKAAGAFAWSVGSKDAALLVSLLPGAYTVLVSGKDGGTGLAVVEIYEVD